MTTYQKQLHIPDFYSRLRKVVGVQINNTTGDSELADDIIQDVAEEILRKVARNPKIEISISLVHWIARMKLNDHFRKTLGRDSGAPKNRDLDDLVEEPLTPEEVTAHRELAAMIEKFAASRSEIKLQIVHDLKNGHTGREIAADRGVTESAVSQHVGEIRRTMNKRLAS